MTRSLRIQTEHFGSHTLTMRFRIVFFFSFSFLFFFFCNGTKFELSLLFKFVTFNFNFSLFTQNLYFYSGLRILICLRKIYAFIADCEFLCLRGNIFDNLFNISVSNFVTYLTIYVTQGNIKDTKWGTCCNIWWPKRISTFRLLRYLDENIELHCY